MASQATRADNAADGLHVEGTNAPPRKRVYLVVLIISVIACVVYANVPTAAAESLFQLVVWSAFAATWRGIRRHRATPLPWALITVGFALFAVGDIIFAVYDLVVRDSPFPSFADVAYLGGYAPLVTGLILLVRRSSSGVGRMVLIDAGIVLTPAVVAAWIYLMAPLANAHDTSLVERLVSMAYPTADLLCLAVMVRLVIGMSFESDRRQPALTLLLVALLVTLIADIVFVSLELSDSEFSLGSWFNALYMVPPLALAGLASTPSVARIDDRTTRQPLALSRRRLTLLALAALVTPGVLLVQWLRGVSLSIPLVVVGTTVSFLLVIARMAGLVAELEKSQVTLQFDATHDLLTRLPNRQLFTEELERTLDTRRAGALLFIDLDRFKAINDTLGHLAGDEVLVEIADRLRSSVRSQDRVGRMSGDEFVVMIDSGDDGEVLAIAKRLVESLVVERRHGDEVLRVTASIGMVRWPRNTSKDRAESLFGAADRAMYGAKNAQGNQLSIDFPG